MNKSDNLFGIYVPFIIFVLLALFLFNERSGIDYQIVDSNLSFLEPKEQEDFISDLDQKTKNLILFDSSDQYGNANFQVVLDTLDSMRVKYDTVDMKSDPEINFSEYEIIVVSILDLEIMRNGAPNLIEWVKGGGKVMFSIRPELTPTFYSIYRKLGILSLGGKYRNISSLQFTTNLIPGSIDQVFTDDTMNQSILLLELENDSEIHLVSGDEFQTPVLWEYNYGDGEIVFCNTDFFTDKRSRGVVSAAYNLLFDVFAYPVINSSVFFIDDFPGPISSGENNLIRKQFGRDIQSFLINIWWPDMQNMAIKYKFSYTSSLIESFTQSLTPPFEFDGDFDNYNYFGGTLLSNGGEIGIHGFNHVPLCGEAEGVNQRLDYPVWNSPENMQESVYSAAKFVKTLFPEQQLKLYVPPSNILCDNSREWLLKVLPDLKVVSSIYYSNDEELAFIQEFAEQGDGIIDLPRIASHYDLSGDNSRWVIMSEINLHYINSHFVHPDEAFRSEVGEEKGWTYLRDQYENYLLWLHTLAPNIRNMTASEAAMAVQRFDRLIVERDYDGISYKMNFLNFYDEAWMLLHSDRIPASVNGGTVSVVSENVYLLKVENDFVEIWFKE